MVVFIAFMNMFIPLSIDLYLPALPEMGGYFNAPQALVSLTVTSFYITYAISMIMFGPLSDKYGRRPVLMSGACIYTLASVLCALSPNIHVLIGGRIMEAIGAGATITVSTALIKDIFSGERMKKILAITQALGVIAPMVAPVIGGVLLIFTSWHGAFILLSILGTINFLLACLFTETLLPQERYHGTIVKSMSLLWDVARRKVFIVLLLVFACFSIPFMAYINLSAFIYVENFGLSAQTYSHYYALNASFSILGPFLYLQLSNRLSRVKLTHVCFAFAVISSVALFTVGQNGAIIFLMCFVPFTLANSFTKSHCMNWLLGTTDDNAGTASSVIKFVQTMFGSIGMMAASLPWPNYVHGLTIIMLAAVSLSFILWQFAQRIACNAKNV
ncbi:multidrug effflux MFS transporter [Anaerovibrio sp. RM50]|uniref:multidrug effflux MFS transporter n=1 Tax=Anaerovibrio sp. RM50 TaxID=1200557 RepID=UPI00090777D1|nr:multidrug effflux MFS transporter [Anaerovibrio sp. RM50]